jgi:hypothetical protein
VVTANFGQTSTVANIGYSRCRSTPGFQEQYLLATQVDQDIASLWEVRLNFREPQVRCYAAMGERRMYHSRISSPVHQSLWDWAAFRRKDKAVIVMGSILPEEGEAVGASCFWVPPLRWTR